MRLAEIKYTNQARHEFLKKPVVEKYNKLYEKLTVKPSTYQANSQTNSPSRSKQCESAYKKTDAWRKFTVST